MIITRSCSSRSSHLSLSDSNIDFDLRRPSHIQRLPPEILGIIFCHALPSKSDFVEPSIRTAPLLLGRVCKYWRDLAERTPELWSSISLFLLRPYALATRAFERWIARSGNCPLRFKLVVLTSYHPDVRIHHKLRNEHGQTVERQHPLMEFIHNIARQSYRWQVADIAVPGCFMQSLLAHDAPMLRKLTLSDPLAEAGSDAFDSWEHTFALSAAPALSQLVLKQRLKILPSECHPLTSVQFDAFSSSQIVELFNGCPSLEELGITFKREIMVSGGPDVWIFPRLHTLRVSLHHSNAREASVFLDRLRLPVLRNLTLDGLRHAHGLHLTTLLDRTDGNLTSLSLINISISHADMFEYLHRVPHLLSLRLVDTHGFDYRCLRRLTWLPGWQTCVCPKLRELWLLRSECSMLATEVVENMVSSRSPGGGAASKLTEKAKMKGAIDRHHHSSVIGDPEPLREFRFDGSKLQHEELLGRPRVKAAIENGLVWKR